MIDLQAIRTRLKALGLFRFVSDWVSVTDALENSQAVMPPAAFVTVSSERPEANTLSTGRIRQRVMTQVSVLMVVAAQRGDGRQTDPIEAIRQPVFNSLFGWQVPGSELPFTYGGFSPRFQGDGLVWFELLLNTKYTVSK